MAASEPLVQFPPVLETRHPDAPAPWDLDKCIHCGLCLNNCPTYRELGVEMDSPRGRIYQMVLVATGQIEPGASYFEHLDLCLACRGCESVCPSGVPYGRMIEAARAEIEANAETTRPWLNRTWRTFIFDRFLLSRRLIKTAGALVYLYEASGLRRLTEGSGILNLLGKFGRIAPLAPNAQVPFFFDSIGRTFPAQKERKLRVGLLAGCLANVTSARLNDATVRVLQRNGCEVVVPETQTCCGALHVHAGRREKARQLARANIDAFLEAGCDFIVTNAAGCGSTLKEYDELLHGDPTYAEKAKLFVSRTRDISELLASLELDPSMRPLNLTVTYQDSCHLAHAQKIREAPRKVLRSIPGVNFVELPLADLCCGSAGTYNIVHDDIADSLLRKKMDLINSTGATVITTANVGCALQLAAGVRKYGNRQRVLHVIELLDEAYRPA